MKNIRYCIFGPHRKVGKITYPGDERHNISYRIVKKNVMWRCCILGVNCIYKLKLLDNFVFLKKI